MSTQLCFVRLAAYYFIISDSNNQSPCSGHFHFFLKYVLFIFVVALLRLVVNGTPVVHFNEGLC
jgi:hypothetical protein